MRYWVRLPPFIIVRRILRQPRPQTKTPRTLRINWRRRRWEAEGRGHGLPSQGVAGGLIQRQDREVGNHEKCHERRTEEM